jgi:hypothetical protein
LALASVLLGCGGGGGSSSADTITPGLIIVVWTAPSTNTDGSTPADVAGYRVRYGTDAQQLTQSLDVSAAATTAQIAGLSAGTYYVRVQALSATGAVSDPSNTAVIALP